MEDRSGAAMLRIPVASLAALHRVLAQDHPPAEAARLARQVGFESGSAFHAALAETLPPQDASEVGRLPAQAFWAGLGDFFSSLGWGELRFEELHPGVASLSSESWAEAEGRTSQQPSCHVTTGLLAEMLSRVAGTDLAVMEVECLTRGDRRCRFLVGSPDALGGVYQQLRQGQPFDVALGQLA